MEELNLNVATDGGDDMNEENNEDGNEGMPATDDNMGEENTDEDNA